MIINVRGNHPDAYCVKSNTARPPCDAGNEIFVLRGLRFRVSPCPVSSSHPSNRHALKLIPVNAIPSVFLYGSALSIRNVLNHLRNISNRNIWNGTKGDKTVFCECSFRTSESRDVNAGGNVKNIIFANIIVGRSVDRRGGKSANWRCSIDGFNPARVLCNLSFASERARSCAWIYVESGRYTYRHAHRPPCRRQSTFNGAHFIFMPDYLWNANRLLDEPLQKTEQLAAETILAYLHGYSFRNFSTVPPTPHTAPPIYPKHPPPSIATLFLTNPYASELAGSRPSIPIPISPIFFFQLPTAIHLVKLLN